MKTITPGTEARVEIVTDERHTADAAGNSGVKVLGTAAVIVFLEDAAHRAIADAYDAGEVSVGIAFDVRHVGAALAGAVVDASARVIDVDDRRVSFAVEARHEDRVLMTGTHQRAVVDLERFLARQALDRTSRPESKP